MLLFFFLFELRLFIVSHKLRRKKWRSTELIVDNDGMGHYDDDIFLKQKPFSVS